ncbi:LysR substrate-binding domain-containing protein [Actinophytocola oryzae]|uniref:LysR substrate binding domain-containing protein n=1 Tax=Actinophytocola oryzae TaxID=502181 RepID=A0A4R7VD37_9PSEU|nr:LysR substrate binding domain-containing protein [Actinophytocola oryzae]
MPRGLADALTTGAPDVAFVSTTGAVSPALKLTLITRDPLVLLPPNHPLAESKLSLELLAGEDWIDGTEGYGNRIIVDAAFARAGLSSRPTVQDWITRQGEGKPKLPHGLGEESWGRRAPHYGGARRATEGEGCRHRR